MLTNSRTTRQRAAQRSVVSEQSQERADSISDDRPEYRRESNKRKHHFDESLLSNLELILGGRRRNPRNACPPRSDGSRMPGAETRGKRITPAAFSPRPKVQARAKTAPPAPQIPRSGPSRRLRTLEVWWSQVHCPNWVHCVLSAVDGLESVHCAFNSRPLQ
jgi:hypothetical protein